MSKSTVFLAKRLMDFDKTMKIIQSHHLNDYNDCTVQRLCTGCKISKEQSLGRFIKPYLMGYLTIFAKKIGVAEATPKIVILSYALISSMEVYFKPMASSHLASSSFASCGEFCAMLPRISSPFNTFAWVAFSLYCSVLPLVFLFFCLLFCVYPFAL